MCCADRVESHDAIDLIKQLSPWGWPEKEVTTCGWDVKIKTPGSTSSSEFVAISVSREEHEPVSWNRKIHASQHVQSA